MFKNLTYRKKTQALGIASILLSILAYQLAISDSLELRRNYLNILEESKNASNAPMEITALKKEMKSIDLAIGDRSEKETDVQQEILESLTMYCKEKDIQLTEFPKPKSQNHQNYRLNTNHITMEGGFLPILELIHKFENEYSLGKVVSVHFKSEEKRKTRKKVLYATIYLQNIQRT